MVRDSFIFFIFLKEKILKTITDFMHAECNVGYAFVNFISVEDLLIFAKSRLGVKW
jgi:hypothetical protein